MSLGACINVPRERGWPCSVKRWRGEEERGRGGVSGGSGGVWGEVKMSVGADIKVEEDKAGCVGSHEGHNKRSSCHTVITLTVPSCPLSVPSSSSHSEGNYIWMIQSSCRQ